MKSKPWEIGGDFSWVPLPSSGFMPFPGRSVYFALGRHAVTALLEVFPMMETPRLWVPSYFCPEVVGYWRRDFDVQFYQDDPERSAPDFSTLDVRPQDFVVAVNYFGCRESSTWDQWRRKTKCILIEDHTHDPLSPWARKSRADYVFSSLRKTLPIPDGAVLWSPRGKTLPKYPQLFSATGAVEKLSGMLWKAEYLRGNIEGKIKEKYLAILHRSEVELDRCDVSAPSSFSQVWINNGIPRQWRRQREQNVRRLARGLKRWTTARPLSHSWPKGAAPLGLLLAFENNSIRTDWRSWLQSQNVYCPIHWEEDESHSNGHSGLSSRVLTIPADHRYATKDMDRVVQLLLGRNN